MRGLLLGLAIALAVWGALILGLVIGGRRELAGALATFLPNLVRLFKGLARDPRVPRRVKIALAGAALWIASPIDLIPEFIPVLGPLDDALIAALTIRYTLRHVDSSILEHHWHGTPETLQALLKLAGRRLPEPG